MPEDTRFIASNGCCVYIEINLSTSVGKQSALKDYVNGMETIVIDMPCRLCESKKWKGLIVYSVGDGATLFCNGHLNLTEASELFTM